MEFLLPLLLLFLSDKSREGTNSNGGKGKGIQDSLGAKKEGEIVVSISNILQWLHFDLLASGRYIQIGRMEGETKRWVSACLPVLVGG